MKKTYIILFLSLLIPLCFVENAIATYVFDTSFGFIQRRVYENGIGDHNRIAFQVIDSATGEYPSVNVIVSASLYYGGNELPLYDPWFGPALEETEGYYDDSTQQWIWDTDFTSTNYYRALIDVETLQTGLYTFEVDAIDGKHYTVEYQFDGLIDLPFISSNSFNYYFDPTGNFYMTWEVPDPNSLPSGVETMVRVNLFDATGIYDAVFQTPTDFGYGFVPHEIFSQLGDTVGVHLRLQTDNWQNRAYASYVELNVNDIDTDCDGDVDSSDTECTSEDTDSGGDTSGAGGCFITTTAYGF